MCIRDSPVVRMSVVNARTGRFLNKPLPDDRVVAFHDGDEHGGSSCPYILPQTTQPYHVRPRRTITPFWDESLLMNCNASYFLHPDVLFFFEVLDFGGQIKNLAERKPHKVDPDGWYRLAWGFLRPIEAMQAGEEAGSYSWRLGAGLHRVQLFEYSEMPTYEMEQSPQVWQHWNSGWRQKYRSTLYVGYELVVHKPPSKVVVDNSVARHDILCAAAQEEVGNMTMAQLLERTRHRKQEQQVELADAESRRRRGLEEACVPVSYTHLRAHETPEHLVCRLLLEKKKKKT
eukprot:TRINITY_DN21241_c0_g1_i1.p1 TRINITY_DN21241_c0_g1~~TRINITY_DN21241_c0_g1_i1.p1  ORF type:complete len:288 (-),score=71.87 TRINITY_DN21241_c0_g1_i1:117-980(-)